ncbi:hypothetical protein BG011_002476 [Mortierella polycephala]|uniref:TPR-like protein n=1 Tax=Mortierella polycephala TaxID=41804 RepID=A0A9P6QIK4_9FUNG|nr:hypothetical protein BG011_002476 [Mortierella polycephala]
MDTIQEKLNAALVNKDLGNESFKQGDIKKALTHYHLAVFGLSGLDNQLSGMPVLAARQVEKGATDDQKSEIKTNLAIIYSNMGACHLKNANYKRAIVVCTDALKHDPNNVKAKFRRAQAKLSEGNLAGAEADLTSLGENVPGVKAELEKLRKKSKEADLKQRKAMGGFLSRGRIASDEEDENTKPSEASVEAASAAGASAPKATPKSKPTLASKMNNVNTNRKPKPAPKEEEYKPSTWSGTAPMIQELADGEE